MILGSFLSRAYSAHRKEKTGLITQNLFESFNHLRGLVDYGLC
jgi:hypothetical protein